MPQFLRETYGLIEAPLIIPLLRIAGIVIIGYLVLKVIESGLARVRSFLEGVR